MDTCYHIPDKSQQKPTNKPVRAKKHKRIRLTRRGGAAVQPKPLKKYLKSLDYYISQLTKTQQNVLYVLLRCNFKYKQIYISQGGIAKELGLCRATVSRALFVLESDGLVLNNYRHLKCSKYRLAQILCTKAFALKIAKVFPALLLMFAANVTQVKSLISLVNNKSSRSRNSYVVTKRHLLNSRQDIATKSNSTRLDVFQRKKARPSVKERCMSELTTKDVIESINDVSLSMLGKSMLALFPAIVVQAAHQQLQDFHRKGIPVNNTFGLMLGACKKACPSVDTSYGNPLLLEMQQKHGFSFQDSPLEAQPTQNKIPKTGRAFKRPSGYVPRKHTQPSQNRSTFVPIEHGERHLSINEICAKWVKAISDPNSKHLTNLLGTGYAIKCFQNAIKAHVEHHASAWDIEIEYLIELLNGPLPVSLQNQTAIKYEDYYSAFEERLRILDEDRKTRADRNYSGPTNTLEETPYE